ncbi:MAG: DUF5615 family PIN-like protein [Candidatus Hadarchaeales archaeon]
MKILLDEMFSGLKPFLRILGWDVATVEDVGLKGAEDEKVIEFAEREGMVIVTQEQGVAELAKLKGVRFVLVGLAEIARIIDEKLKSL